MTAEPIHVTDSAFEETVLGAKIPVIVDFWAPWCGPCRMVAPTLEKLAKEYEDKMLVAKVNTDENPEWAGRYQVQGIPTMLFVAQGKIVHRQVGALPEPILREIVTEFLDVVRGVEESDDGAQAEPVEESSQQVEQEASGS
jgi:thioredoxin 1